MSKYLTVIGFILANFFLGIYHNLSVWYKLVDKTKIGAYISIVGAIITLLLNFLLIPVLLCAMGNAQQKLASYSIVLMHAGGVFL